MKSQVLHTAWCYISGEAVGEIRNWSLLGVKGLTLNGVIRIQKLHRIQSDPVKVQTNNLRATGSVDATHRVERSHFQQMRLFTRRFALNRSTRIEHFSFVAISKLLVMASPSGVSSKTEERPVCTWRISGYRGNNLFSFHISLVPQHHPSSRSAASVEIRCPSSWLTSQPSWTGSTRTCWLASARN